jgi:uncharacterized protein YqgC (DUF456 family)
MSWAAEALVALTLLVAVVGTIVPILPGALLAAAAIVIWAFTEGGVGAWVVTAIAVSILVAGQVAKYVVPARTISRDAVTTRVLFAGAIAGVVGFLTVPVIGLPLGFVAGVWGATILTRRTLEGSWQATRTALTAIGLATLIEVATVLWASLIWGAGAIALALA